MAIDMKPEVARERRQRSAKAQALVDALRGGGARRMVTIGDVEVEMRLIKGADTLAGARRAHEQLEKSGLADKSDAAERLVELKAVEYLAASIYEPGGTEPLFADGTELQAVVDETVLGALLLAYGELSKEGELAVDDMLVRKKARELLKKKDWTALSAIAPNLPRSLLITTVEQLSSSLAQRS